MAVVCPLNAPEADYAHFFKCLGNRLHGLGHVRLSHVSHAADTERIGQREATREDNEAPLLHALEQRLKSESRMVGVVEGCHDRRSELIRHDSRESHWRMPSTSRRQLRW